jgi:hypothetical protein
VETAWITGMPEPNPYIQQQVHDYDQVILYCGGDYEAHRDLGAELEYNIGGEPITLNSASEIFIPEGTPHIIVDFE